MSLLLYPTSTFSASSEGQLDNYYFNHGGRQIRVWTYQPMGTTSSSPVLFVMHGMNRNGHYYRKTWMSEADIYGFILLVPEFSNEKWPGGRSYNFGNIIDKNWQLLPRDAWAFTALDAIFDEEVRKRALDARDYYVFGHSAGSQFVHRMLLIYPEAKTKIAVAANAGSYTMPVFNVSWPFGLKRAFVGGENLKDAFAKNLVVLLGEDDNNPNSSSLPKKAGAKAQGPHRLARGKQFFNTAQAVAKDLKYSFRWDLVTIPGVGHSGKQIAPHAAKILFDD